MFNFNCVIYFSLSCVSCSLRVYRSTKKKVNIFKMTRYLINYRVQFSLNLMSMATVRTRTRVCINLYRMIFLDGRAMECVQTFFAKTMTTTTMKEKMKHRKCQWKKQFFFCQVKKFHRWMTHWYIFEECESEFNTMFIYFHVHLFWKYHTFALNMSVIAWIKMLKPANW